MDRSHGLWSLTTQVGITEDDTTAETAREVLGYLDMAAALSTVMGRNLVQASVFRLVGFDIGIYLDAADQVDYAGLWASGDVRFMEPTAHRVKAHKYAAARWLRQARMATVAQSAVVGGRYRQFMVKIDDTMPDAAFHSTFEDPSSATDVEYGLFGTSVAGTYTAIMDEFNAYYPPYPDAASGEDQRLYTDIADDSTPAIIPWTVSQTYNWHEDETTGVVESRFGKQATVFQCRAPAGHHWDVFCGMLDIGMNATSVALAAGTPSTCELIFTFYIAGWRDLR